MSGNIADEEPSVPVSVEPHGDISDDRIVELLTEAGATEIEILDPGYISALLPQSAMDSLNEYARIRPKPINQIKAVTPCR